MRLKEELRREGRRRAKEKGERNEEVP